MGDDDSVVVVRRLIELVSDLAVESALDLVTEDLVLELPFRGDGGPRRMVGVDARRFIATLPKLLSKLSLYDVVVHGALPNGMVVAEYRSDGATRAGRPHLNTYIALLGVRDGRIHFWREYFDPTVITAAFATD